LAANVGLLNQFEQRSSKIMTLSSFVVRDAILPKLASETKEGVIREMVRSLQQAGYFRENEIEEIVLAVMRREALGSTGIGRNIAIPHSRYVGVDRLIGTLAISGSGIDFNSIDAEPVFVLVLLVSPQDRPADHLRALETVVRTMRDDKFVQQLRNCTSQEAIWQLLNESGGTHV
jgi:nitrogen PTS system EIIA component